MRRSTFLLATSVLLIFILVGIAFVYIDLTGHKSFYYTLTKQGAPYGAVVIDRYTTESKVVYKSREVTPFSVGYPAFSSSLYLDKVAKTPSKYQKEDMGARGQRTVTSLVQKEELTDYLFLENPRFIKVENFSTGEKTMVYSPEDLMLVTALMERYSFWKKGTQYFEVMIPVPVPLPPLRDKVSVRYKGEDYLTVMGSKVEAEIYVIGSKALDEIKIAVSRHSHRILSMECPKTGRMYVLSSVKEGAMKLSAFSFKRLPFVREAMRNIPSDDELVITDHSGSLKQLSTEKIFIPERMESKEVFFESGNTVLCAEIWMPEGEGPFRTVILVPGEEPKKTGERIFTVYLGSFLARSGYMVLSFDPQGQGKSQGSFYETDDEVKTRNIDSAVKFLRGQKEAAQGEIIILASGPAVSSALESAAKEGSGAACVVIAPFFNTIEGKNGQTVSEQDIMMLPGIFDPNAFDKGFISKVSDEARKNYASVESSEGDISFFMGIGLPLKGYRNYLSRKPYQKMVSLEGPLLVIAGEDDVAFDKRALEALRTDIGLKNQASEVFLLNKSEKYGGTVLFADDKWQYVPSRQFFGELIRWMNKFKVQVDVSGEVGQT